MPARRPASGLRLAATSCACAVWHARLGLGRGKYGTPWPKPCATANPQLIAAGPRRSSSQQASLRTRVSERHGHPANADQARLVQGIHGSQGLRVAQWVKVRCGTKVRCGI